MGSGFTSSPAKIKSPISFPMDLFEIDTVKAEKANAMKKYRRIKKIAIFFRFVEVCIAFVFISWLSARLPIAFKLSGDFFRQLSVVLVSPIFVFLVGNAIVITLFFKSGQNTAVNSSGVDLYDEFMQNSEIRHKARKEASPPGAEAETVCVDKAVVYAEKTCPSSDTTDTEAGSRKAFQRSRSENMSGEKKRDLRRSETEIGRKTPELSPELSNEEFRRRIEQFIARHQKFLREESMAIVLKSE
ncbi:hypothetical protein ACLOJK_032662 [Asimina triloba]